MLKPLSPSLLVLLLGLACAKASSPVNAAPEPAGFSAEAIASDGVQAPVDSTSSADGSTFYFVATGRNGPGVFRVTTAGKQVTELYSGAPFAAPAGIAISPDDHTLYVADPEAAGGGTLFKLSVEPGSPAPIQATTGLHPRGVEAVAGLVYFTGTDTSTRTGRAPGVFRLRAEASVERVYAGSALHDPSGLAVTRNGEVFIADYRGGKARADLVHVAGGLASVVVADLAVDAPVGVALTGDERSVLVSGLDASTHGALVYRVDLDSKAVTTLDRGIASNTGSGGVHRAAKAEVYAWVGRRSVQVGTIYRIQLGSLLGSSCSRYGDSCNVDIDCCPGGSCQQGKCFPPPESGVGGPCTFSVNCAFGLSCIAGTCRDRCTTFGAVCYHDAECCAGLVCGDLGAFGGFCQQPSCKRANTACNGPTECCADEALGCVDNGCTQVGCRAAGAFCGGGGCCSGLTCQSSRCVAATQCSNDGVSCQAASECCSGYCRSGACAGGCGIAATACTRDSACCSGLVCFGGACRSSDVCLPAQQPCSATKPCCSNVCNGGSCT